jgi:parvulin-like peptidyl-prolyl isomerase
VRHYSLFISLIISGICSYSALRSAPAVGSTQTPQVTSVGQFEPLLPASSSTLLEEPKRIAGQAFENGRPLAARINNQPLYLDVYEAQIAQFERSRRAQESVSVEPDTSLSQIRQQVLDGLLDQLLIEQQAELLGIRITDEEVETKAQEIITQLESQQQFETWLANNQFTYEIFLAHLRSQLVANRLFEQVTQDAPATAEQIWLRYIRVSDSPTVQTIVEQLKTGSDFVMLAQIYSLDEEKGIEEGDLGWMPKQAGLLPAGVENLAFSLHPGEIGGPIQTGQGFYIVKLEARDAARPLTPEMRQLLKKQIFVEWLQEKRGAATIEKYVALY